MLPLILAAGSMLGSAAGQNAANAATVEGAKTQSEINQQAIANRMAIQDDLTARNKPYYDQGINQLPGILAMSKNPDFASTDPTYGDKYSLGAQQMMLSGLKGSGGRQLVSDAELNTGFNASEQGRLLNRKLDQLKIGYGQAGTAGQSLMSTGTAIAGISDRIGADRANAMSLSSLGRQNMVNGVVNDASYVPMYLNYKKLNSEASNG